MSQHDFDIANQGFAAFRADLNNALKALGSLSSGTAEPATTYANQLWYETDTNILHIRDEANAAWLDLMTINQTTGSPSFTAGNVGIGTSSPADVLDVAAAADGGIRLTDSTNEARFCQITQSAARLTLSADPTNAVATSFINFLVDATERMRIASSGNVGIGTNAPVSALHLASTAGPFITFQDNDAGANQPYIGTEGTAGSLIYSTGGTSASHIFELNRGASEAARIDSSGNLLVGKTSTLASVAGGQMSANGEGVFTVLAGDVLTLNRQNNDGTIVSFRQANTQEGSISVSGTTVSYNGGHLSRWAQFPDNSRPELLKGTVLSNLDQMSNWDGEDNEQLNCVQVSTVEGDANVAGVFVAWDTTEDDYNDILLAMTGDMVIRIGAGVTVARGDLLMSAGDGTAKPQGDDIVRSKTIAKVTSTHVSHTYADGSYAVPCVLMAC